MTRRHRGFTLVELLVVIGIIAVLAALIFPAFFKAREKGREASCLSNIRQINQAILLYAQDNRGFLPNFATVWHDINVAKPVYVCPSVGKTMTNAYGYNLRAAAMPVAELPFPLRTILIADSNGPSNVLYTEYNLRDPAYRHNSGMVAGYLDGHAARVTAANADLSFPGDKIRGKKAFVEKFCIDIYDDKPFDYYVNYPLNTPNPPRIKIKGLAGSPCPHSLSNGGVNDRCLGPYVDDFYALLSEEGSLLPTHVLHAHGGESPSPGALFDLVLLDNFDHDYMLVKMDDINAPDELKHRRLLLVDIDHKATMDFNSVDDQGVRAHRHKSPLTRKEIDQILYYALEMQAGLPADGDPEQRPDTMATVFADLFTNPKDTEAKARASATYGQQVDTLKAALEKQFPDLDDEYWQWLARVRDTRPSTNLKPLRLE